MANKKITFQYSGATDIGHGREHNEDYYICEPIGPNALLLAVADGMGGYHGGATASKLVIDTLFDSLNASITEASLEKDIQNLLVNAANAANNKLREARQANAGLDQMGTTLVAVLSIGSYGCLIHAGDSRCYLYHENQLTQLTEDDTVAQALVNRGALTQDQAAQSPFRHRLTQALGPDEHINFHCQHLQLSAGDVLVLCSDGLYDVIGDSQFKEALSVEMSVDRRAEKLIQASLSNETNDNSSVIVLAVNDIDE